MENKKNGLVRKLTESRNVWTLLLKCLVLMLIPTAVAVGVHKLVPLIFGDANLYKVAVGAMVTDAVIRTLTLAAMVALAIGFAFAKQKIVGTTISTDVINTVFALLIFAGAVYGRIWLGGFIMDEIAFETVQTFYYPNIVYLFVTSIVYAVFFLALTALAIVRLVRRSRR